MNHSRAPSAFGLWEAGRHAQRAGDLDAAREALLAAAAQPELPPEGYQEMMDTLAEVLVQRGEFRAALTVHWYRLASVPPEHAARELARLRPFEARVPAVDHARTLAALGRVDEAARAMSRENRSVAEALLRERADDWGRALGAWQSIRGAVANAPTEHASGETAYRTALVHLNVARCADRTGEPAPAVRARTEAVHLLEEARASFEAGGRRDRAFDCCEALVAIGTDARAHFEDALEGLVGGIRLLREDGMIRAAHNAFDQAIELCAAHDEPLAGAIFAAEASAFARQASLPEEAARYLVRQAACARDLARARRNGPPPAIEAALLQAVLPLADLGQMARVGSLYAELAELDLPAERKARYARAAHFCEGALDETLPNVVARAHELGSTQSFLGGPSARASWQSDLLEWEEGAQAAEVCATVLLDPAWPDLVRRRALLARIVAIESLAGMDAGAPAAWAGGLARKQVRLAEALASVQLYAALAPLEALFDRGAAEVRVAAVVGASTLPFPRSFVTLERGLADREASVREAATEALRGLRFPQARGRLTYLALHAGSASARASAEEALGGLTQGRLALG